MDQILSQLYSSCDESVQNSIINTVKNFCSLSEADILREIETIVTQKSNPSVHRMVFSYQKLHHSFKIRRFGL